MTPLCIALLLLAEVAPVPAVETAPEPAPPQSSDSTALPSTPEALPPAPAPAPIPAPAAVAPTAPIPAPAAAPPAAAPPLPTATGAPSRNAAPPALRRSGIFGAGINLDLLELGTLQAFGSGGSANGLLLGLGPEIDLGTHWALRTPLEIQLALGSGSSSAEQANSFVAVTLTPGLVYRFRSREGAHWIPYLGGAFALGAFQFGRGLLGLEASPAGISQSFVRMGAAPELLGGVLFAPSRIFMLRFGATYSFFWVAHTSLHVLSEGISVRFSF
jgi:hypothetical protein